MFHWVKTSASLIFLKSYFAFIFWRTFFSLNFPSIKEQHMSIFPILLKNFPIVGSKLEFKGVRNSILTASLWLYEMWERERDMGKREKVRLCVCVCVSLCVWNWVCMCVSMFVCLHTHEIHRKKDEFLKI